MNPSHHSLEALDLHLIKQNTPTPAQSTWLASQLSKKTGSRSVLALVDTPSGCVIPHPHFLKRADKKILLTSNEIKPIYSDIISKLFREQDRDAIFESLSSEYSCIDAVMNKRHAKHHEMIFRIGYKTSSGQTTFRLLYIDTNHDVGSIQLYYRLFGNVDVAVIPFNPHVAHDDNITWYEQPEVAPIGLLSMANLITLSTYLDHGQSLNLKTLHKFRDQNPIKDNLIHNTDTPYQQNLEDFYYHAAHAPSGQALLYNQSVQYIAHLSRFKKEITKSGKISTSNGGCLGNVIYSVKLLNDAQGHQYMPGMSIGLSARLFSTTIPKEETIFLFHIKNKGNELTNWVNSFGFGRLKLEAMLHLTQHPSYIKKLNAACRASVFLYHQFKPLLSFFKQYSMRRAFHHTLSDDRSHALTTMEFNQFWALFTSGRRLPENEHGLSTFYLLNNLLFEVLKDYVLLYQKTEEQRAFNAYGSYDMHNQYQFFFGVDSDLKDKGFKTEYFTPEYQQILNQLEAHHAIDLTNTEDILHFQKFMLDRFSAAINVYALEGQPMLNASLVTEKTLNAIYPFLEIASELPNLCGNLVHGVLTKATTNSSMEEALLKNYHKKLRELYGLSYDERQIILPIKTNLFETDETGVRENYNTTVHDIKLKNTNNALYEITHISDPLPIIIEGVSARVQLRADECEKINVENLIKLVDMFKKPIEAWSLEQLTHVEVGLNENKYTPLQLENHGLIETFCEIAENLAPASAEKRLCFHLKLTFLILEIFQLINIKSYHSASQTLNEFSLKHNCPHQTLIDLLISNQHRGGDLYKASVLYFVSRYYMLSEESNHPLIYTLLRLSEEMMNTPNAKAKTLLTQALIEGVKKNHPNATQLLMEILRQEQSQQHEPNLDIYHEVANFLKSHWIKLKLDDVHLFTEFFLTGLERGHAVNTLLSALSNISTLPYLRAMFLKTSVINSLLRQEHHKNDRMVESILKILLNLSFGTTQEKQGLLTSTFSFLISAFEFHPRLSRRIFSILNNLLDVMTINSIEKITQMVEHSVFDNRRLLFSSFSFFTKLHRNKSPFITERPSPLLLGKDIHQDNIDISLIEFVSSAFKFFKFEDTLLNMILTIITDRIGNIKSLDLRYYKALERLLEEEKHQLFFLTHDGLNTLISAGASLQKAELKTIYHHDMASALLAILNLFSEQSLNYESISKIDMSLFYEALFQEEDLIVELTAFILKLNFGASLIAEKLAQAPQNSEAQINIITGLAEIEITTDRCEHILQSNLCQVLFSIVEQHEAFDDDLRRSVSMALINFYSRKRLREQRIFYDLKNTLLSIELDEQDDPDVYADWQCLIQNIERSESSPEIPSIALIELEPSERLDRIIRSSYELNELPLTSKESLIEEVIDLLKSQNPILENHAAVLLEKLSRNKHYSNHISKDCIISALKEKLEHPIAPPSTRVAIIDTLFWLTVNNHRHTEMIINTISLPLLLNPLLLSNTDAGVIRATLGLLVNAEFSDENNQTLLPYIDVFIHFLEHDSLKIVNNALELLQSLSCVPYAFVTLTDDNRFELYKRLAELKQQNPDNDDLQEPIETLLGSPYLFNKQIKNQIMAQDNPMHTIKNNPYTLFNIKDSGLISPKKEAQTTALSFNNKT